MPTFSRQDFLKTFKFDPNPKQNFIIAGKPAGWASGKPKEWGQESESFQIEDSILGSEKAYGGVGSTLSPDQKLIAITSCVGKIGVYDVATHELRAVLEGMKKCIFIPGFANSGEIDVSDTRVGRPAYTLLTSISTGIKPLERSRRDTLLFWDLDKNGRVLDAEEDIDVASFATKAIESILPELEANHEWTREFVNSSILHTELSRILSETAASYRRRHNTMIKDALLGGYNSNPVSSDGKKLVYLTNKTNPSSSSENESDTHQKFVVYDLENNKPLHTHSGYTDHIVWTGFSPDDQLVASVCWDGKLRMYSAVTGTHLYSIGKANGGQAWTASFSPDSQFIVWSSQNGNAIQVHSITDGALISTFPSDSVGFWYVFQELAWHPDGQKILLSTDQHVFIWRPFDESPAISDSKNGNIIQTYEMGGDTTPFFFISSAMYLDEGRKVAVLSSDGTRLVWDERTNSREIFKKPDGLEVGWVEHNIHFLGTGNEKGNEVLVSVDGDAEVRYWRVGFSELVDAEGEVDVTRDSELDVESPDKAGDVGESGVGERSTDLAGHRKEGARDTWDTWAERGAELWTAE